MTQVHNEVERPDLGLPMKFLSGARNRTVTYVVRPARNVYDVEKGVMVPIPGIRVKFREHKLDLNKQAEVEGWDEGDRAQGKPPGTTRKLVHDHLINHRDWGASDGRGIFYDTSDTLTELSLRKRSDLRKRCAFTQDAGDGRLVKCPETVPPDQAQETDYCPAHRIVVEQALAVIEAGGGDDGFVDVSSPPEGTVVPDSDPPLGMDDETIEQVVGVGPDSQGDGG